MFLNCNMFFSLILVFFKNISDMGKTLLIWKFQNARDIKLDSDYNQQLRKYFEQYKTHLEPFNRA